MGSVFYYALSALVGGLYLIGHHFWVIRELTDSKMSLYTGIWCALLGAAGLVYWRWRRNKLRARHAKPAA